MFTSLFGTLHLDSKSVDRGKTFYQFPFYCLNRCGEAFQTNNKDDDRDLDYSFCGFNHNIHDGTSSSTSRCIENIQVFLLITNGLIEGLLLLLWISK